MENIFMELVKDEEEKHDQDNEDVNTETIHRLIESMTNEYDRWVATALLVCAGKMHGMTTMRARQLLQDLEERLDKWEASKSAAEVFVSQRLDHRIENLEARVKALTEQIQVASIRWTPERVGDLENERSILQESLENVKKLKAAETPYTRQCLKQAVKRKADQIAEDERIKKRARGAGHKTMMDEEDEKWLAKCIEDKTTVHGRRHESVLYTHHRVKSRDLLKLANYRRLRLGLPLIRAVSTVNSRARARRLKSLQSRRHKGLGLWCSKKPPKTEERDNECTHHQRKHVSLAKEHLFGVEAGERRKFAVAISMDDKAYLRPGTSEGFHGSRRQSVLQPTDDQAAKRLPVHDFPEPSMYITPSAFRLLKKEPSQFEATTLVSSDDSSMAVVHPKAYIGTHGTTWASNYMRLRREFPDDFEVPGTAVLKDVRKLFCRTRDATKYFLDTAMEADVKCVTEGPDCPFRSYTNLQLKSFKQQLEQGTQDWFQVKDSLSAAYVALGSEVISQVSGVVTAVENAVATLASSSKKNVWDCYKPLIKACQDLLKHLDITPMPMVCPQIIELTDAGPGVGVSNFEVRFRAAEKIRIHSTDLLCRIHRAREDSGQNEAERLNACLGEAICDGGTIQWQIFSETHGLTETEISTMTRLVLEDHAQKMMENNAWAVAEEVRLRIDQSPAPAGFTRALTVEKTELQFFYNREFLQRYMTSGKTQRSSVPGHNYFQKIESFIDRHFEIGELYMEFLKGSCKGSGSLCDFCSSNPLSGPPITRIPKPYPDHQQLPALKYCPYNRTPVDGRLPDDFQPRAQLKKAVLHRDVQLDNPISISEFAQKYVVDERCVREYVQHIKRMDLMKAKRSAEIDDRKVQSNAKKYDDYDWKELYRQGQLSKLRVSDLDKYLSKHGLQQTCRKSIKLEMVGAHIGKTVCSSVLCDLAALPTDDPASDTESELDLSSDESEDDVVLEVGDSDAADVDRDVGENEPNVSRFGRLRQKVVNKDYIFF
ncbi:uncharacterized protein [Paramisgurnus dabryanus]